MAVTLNDDAQKQALASIARFCADELHQLVGKAQFADDS